MIDEVLSIRSVWRETVPY